MAGTRWRRGPGADSAGCACGVAAVAVPWFMAVTIREPGFLILLLGTPRHSVHDEHDSRRAVVVLHPGTRNRHVPGIVSVTGAGRLSIPTLERAAGVPHPGPRLPADFGHLDDRLFFAQHGEARPYVLPACRCCACLWERCSTARSSRETATSSSADGRWIAFHGTRVALIAGMVLGVVDFFIDGGDRDQWAESTLLVGGSIFLYWFVSPKICRAAGPVGLRRRGAHGRAGDRHGGHLPHDRHQSLAGRAVELAAGQGKSTCRSSASVATRTA